MSGIDDPVEAIKQQYREQPDPVLDVILGVAGTLHPFAGIVNVIRTHFSRTGAEERTRAVLEALEDAVRQHDLDTTRLRNRLESPEFVEALVGAVSEAIRTSRDVQIKRFGTILGHTIAQGSNLSEAAAYIRDLAQLTEADIGALQILHGVQGELLSAEVTTDPNPYTQRITGVLEAVDQAGFARDEFYARCSRLTGFGFALEVNRFSIDQARCYPSRFDRGT